MHIFITIAAAMFVGLMLTRLAKLIHLPNVTAYLVAGLLIGPYGFKLIQGAGLETLDLITTIALGFIAFSIGGEFKLSSIKRLGSGIMTITLFQALTAVVLVDAALILCGFPIPLAITLGAIAAATAPAATLMVVRQYKAHGPVTDTLLPVVAIDDAVGLVVFSVSIAIAGALDSNAAITLQSTLVAPVLEIFFSILIGAVIGAALAFIARLFHSRVNTVCLFISAVFLGVGISESYGLSSLLLCMAIGMVYVNLHKESDRMLEACERWTPSVYLLFFVISGADLDLTVLPTVGLLGLVYFIVRSLGKYFGSMVGSHLAHASPNVKKYLGITLLPQAGVAIGMAKLAMTGLPAYGAEIRAVVLSATLIYELVGPLLTKIALTKAGEIESSPKRQKKIKSA